VVLTEPERIARGERAQRLLADEMLQDALAILEEAYTAMWKGSAAADTAKREDAYHLSRNLQHFKRHLGLVLQDGKLAASELQKQEQSRTQRRVA
jgi:hypothetical protein